MRWLVVWCGEMNIAETQNTRTTFSFWRDKDHPVWGLLKPLFIAASCTLLLTFNATNFDSGEVRTAVVTYLIAQFLEGFNVKRKN
jgi:hypothetical protein